MNRSDLVAVDMAVEALVNLELVLYWLCAALDQFMLCTSAQSEAQLANPPEASDTNRELDQAVGVCWTRS